MVPAGIPSAAARAQGRPTWAGPVQVKTRQRPLAPGQMAHTVELSGLVLPGPPAAHASAASIGHGLGFPRLAAHLAEMQPEMLKSMGQFESVVREAASRVQSAGGSSSLQRAGVTGGHTPSAVPEHALHLRFQARMVRSTLQQDQGRLLRPQVVSGEVSRVFAIRDVSGKKLRFESAGAAANFTVTGSSTHWSRDPRQL